MWRVTVPKSKEKKTKRTTFSPASLPENDSAIDSIKRRGSPQKNKNYYYGMDSKPSRRVAPLASGFLQTILFQFAECRLRPAWSRSIDFPGLGTYFRHAVRGANF